MKTRMSVCTVLAIIVLVGLLGSGSLPTTFAASPQLISLAPTTTPTKKPTPVPTLNASSASKSPTGDNVWTSNGPQGGNVKALVVDPQTPTTLYAGIGSDTGQGGAGVFKSIDSGTNWNAVNTGITNTLVSAMAIDPQNPSNVYVGTRYGVFKTTNGGATWNATGGPFGDMKIYTLVIDPQTPTTLYATGNYAGVYRTTNSGNTWNYIGLTWDWPWALAIDPTTPTTLYAGTGSYGVYKSTNGGVNWNQINTGLTNLAVHAIAVDPITPSTVYVGTENGVFKSTNSGGNWTAVNTGLTNNYIQALAIDPQTPTTLYAGTAGGGAFKSTNGGGNWTAMNTGLGVSINSLAINPQVPATLYAGTVGGGVFKSTNGGSSWSTANSGLNYSLAIALAIDAQTPSTLYVGTIGAGIFKSTNNGGSWIPISNGLANGSVKAIQINRSTPTTLYAATYGGGMFTTTDRGANWSPINTGLSNLYVNALTGEGITMYAGTNGGVFKSANAGANWSAASIGLTNNFISALAIDPNTPTTLYAGTSGGVFKSTDSSANWSAVNSGLTNSYVYALAIDPNTPTTLYAGTSGGVFKSTDSGANWSAVNSGLTNSYVYALVIDPQTPNTLYAGTSGGMFKSTDGGANWSTFNTGLTVMDVRALAIDPQTSTTLYAGTYGGGVFAMSQTYQTFAGAISPVYPNSHSAASTVMQGGTVYRYFRVLNSSSNPIANATITFSVGSPVVSDASGYFAATIPTSALGGLGTYTVNVQSVTYGGQTYSTGGQPSFGVQVTPRQYSNSWSYGVIRQASAGTSTGLIAFLQMQSNGGLGLTLNESDPNRTDDDQVEMEETYSTETTDGLGAGLRTNINVGVKANLDASLTTERSLRNFGSIKALFSQPYSDADRKAQSIFLGLSVLDSVSGNGPVQPIVVRMLEIAEPQSAYLNYISEQSSGTSAKVTPLKAGLGADVSLSAKKTGSQNKGLTLGFTLLDVGASRLVTAILTDYGNEYSAGFEDELSADLTLLSPDLPLVKTRLIGLIGNYSRRIHKEYFFDSVTNQLKRVELTLSSEGNPSAFTDVTKKQVSTKLTFQGAGLTPSLVEAVGQAQAVSNLNSLLHAVPQIPYEVLVEDSSNVNVVPELGIPGTEIKIGMGIEVEKSRNLVRERGVFVSEQSYITEMYVADSFVAQPGKNWTDLTANALGGLWLIVRDSFNWFAQQVTSGIGWIMNIVARDAGGVVKGGAQLNVPSGTQLQMITAKGPRVPLTTPITVTAVAWTPSPVGSGNRPQRDSIRAASGSGFVVGGIFEFQPYTMTLSSPATLTITYTNESAVGIDKSRIGVFRWNTSGNNWQSVSGQSSDPASNQVSASIMQLGTYALGYDASAPQITNISPANSSIITNTMPVISALVSDTGLGINPTSVQMRLDGQTVPATFIPGTGQLIYMPPNALSNGTHIVAISAQDMASNPASASATFNIQADIFNYLPLIRK